MLLIGCGTGSGWIAPPYTSVDRIVNVKPGMTIFDVNRILNIDPYDVYHLQEDGSLILVYNYRVKERRMDLPMDTAKRLETIRSEQAQTAGETVYRDEGSRIYVFFRKGIVESLVTDSGKENSEYILLVENNIRLLTAGDIESIRGVKLGDKYFIDSSQPNAAVIQLWERRDQHGKSEQVRQSSDSRFPVIFGAISVLVALILLAVSTE